MSTEDKNYDGFLNDNDSKLSISTETTNYEGFFDDGAVSVGADTNIDIADYTDYIDNVRVEKGEPSLNYQRAVNQSNVEQTINAVPQIIGGVLLGVPENVGYLLELASPLWEDKSDYTNILTEFAQAGREKLNEIAPIYRESNDTIDADDYAWWVQNGVGLLESIGEFAITGAGVGGALMKGAKAISKTQQVGNIASKAAQGLTAATLAYTEGAMSGAQVYKKTYDKALIDGLDEQEAINLASNAASKTVKMNTLINTGLNLTGLNPLFKSNKSLIANKIKGVADIDNAIAKAQQVATANPFKSTTNRYALEALQEATEEVVNVVSEQRGLEAGNVEKRKSLLEIAKSDEALLSAALGAFGGVGQNFVMDKIAGRVTQERAQAEKEVERLQEYRNNIAAQAELLDQLRNAETEEQADIIKNSLFGLTAYRSVLEGKSEGLEGTMEIVRDLDNNTELAPAIQEEIVEIENAIQEAETEEQAVALQEQLAIKQEELKVNGEKTEAMVAGLTDSKEDNTYRETAVAKIQEIQELRKIYNDYQNKYNNTEESQHYNLGGKIFALDASVKRQKLELDKYNDEITNLSNSISTVVDSTDVGDMVGVNLAVEKNANKNAISNFEDDLKNIDDFNSDELYRRYGTTSKAKAKEIVKQKIKKFNKKLEEINESVSNLTYDQKQVDLQVMPLVEKLSSITSDKLILDEEIKNLESRSELLRNSSEERKNLIKDVSKEIKDVQDAREESQKNNDRNQKKEEAFSQARKPKGKDTRTDEEAFSKKREYSSEVGTEDESSFEEEPPEEGGKSLGELLIQERNKNKPVKSNKDLEDNQIEQIGNIVDNPSSALAFSTVENFKYIKDGVEVTTDKEDTINATVNENLLSGNISENDTIIYEVDDAPEKIDIPGVDNAELKPELSVDMIPIKVMHNGEKIGYLHTVNWIEKNRGKLIVKYKKNNDSLTDEQANELVNKEIKKLQIARSIIKNKGKVKSKISSIRAGNTTTRRQDGLVTLDKAFENKKLEFGVVTNDGNVKVSFDDKRSPSEFSMPTNGKLIGSYVVLVPDNYGGTVALPSIKRTLDEQQATDVYTLLQHYLDKSKANESTAKYVASQKTLISLLEKGVHTSMMNNKQINTIANTQAISKGKSANSKERFLIVKDNKILLLQYGIEPIILNSSNINENRQEVVDFLQEMLYNVKAKSLTKKSQVIPSFNSDGTLKEVDYINHVKQYHEVGHKEHKLSDGTYAYLVNPIIDLEIPSNPIQKKEEIQASKEKAIKVAPSVEGIELPPIDEEDDFDGEIVDFNPITKEDNLVLQEAIEGLTSATNLPVSVFNGISDYFYVKTLTDISNTGNSNLALQNTANLLTASGVNNDDALAVIENIKTKLARIKVNVTAEIDLKAVENSVSSTREFTDDETAFGYDQAKDLSSPLFSILSGIQDGEIKDGKFISKKIPLGNSLAPSYVNPDVVINTLKSVLANVPPNEEKIKSVLKEASKEIGFLYPVAKILFSETYKGYDIATLRTELISKFSNAQYDFRTIIYEDTGNGYNTRIISSDQSTNKKLTLNTWREKLKTKSSISELKEEGYVLTQKGIDSTIALADSILNEGLDYKLLLDALGIEISEAAENAIGKGFKRSLVKSIKKSLQNSADGAIDFEQANPLFNNSQIEKLASIEAKYNETLYSTSLLNVEGSQIVSINYHREMTKRDYKLNDNKQYAKKLLTLPFNNNHSREIQKTWLQMYALGEGNSIKLRTLNGIQEQFKSRSGRKPTKLTSSEIEGTRLMSYFDNQDNADGDYAHFVHYVPSKNTTMLVSAPKLELEESALFQGSPTDELIESIYEIVRYESQRINEVDEYGKAGKKFYFFDNLNDLINEDGYYLENEVLENGQTVEQEAKERIRDLFDPNNTKSLIQDTKDNWKKMGFYEEVDDNPDSINPKKYLPPSINNGEDLNLLAAEYIANQMWFQLNMFQTHLGDPAQYSKKSIDGTWDNIFKRLTGTQAPARRLKVDPNHTSYIQLHLEDAKETSKFFNPNHKEYLESFFNSLDDKVKQEYIEAYKDIDSTDAQEYTTYAEHLFVLKQLGDISVEEHDRILVKLNSQSLEGVTENNRLAEREIGIFNPMKPVATGKTFITDANGNEVAESMQYVKSSSFPLIPQFTEGLEIDELRKKMEALETSEGTGNKRVYVRASYDSAYKVGGAKKPYNVKKSEEITKDNYVVLDRDGFGIQQNVPFDYKKDQVVDGSQQRKLIQLIAGMFSDDSAMKQEVSEYNEVYKKLYSQAASELESELTLEDNRLDIPRLQEMLVDEAKNRGWSQNDIDALNIDDEGFVIPLYFNYANTKIEALLQSLISNKVTKRKRKGKSLVLASQYGFKGYSKDIIYSENYDGELKYINNDEEHYAQVIIPQRLLASLPYEEVNIQEPKEIKDKEVTFYNGEIKDSNNLTDENKTVFNLSDINIEELENIKNNNKTTIYFTIPYTKVKEFGKRASDTIGEMTIHKKGNTVQISTVALYSPNGENRTINSGQGVGNYIYNKLGEKLLNEYNLNLTSDKVISIGAEKVWQKLVKANKAVKLSDNTYKYVNKVKQSDDKIVKRIDFSKVDPETLKAFGYRIPTQGYNSMAGLEIVGLLPDYMGDLVIAPREFVVQMGSDFDVDKLQVFLSETEDKYNYDAMFNDMEEQGLLLKEDREVLKSIIINRNFDDLTTLEEIVWDRWNEYKRENKAKYLESVTLRDSDNNKLLKSSLNIMKHPEVKKLTKEPLVTHNVNPAKFSPSKKKNLFIEDNRLNAPRVYHRWFNDKYAEARDGAIGIGVFATLSTFHAIASSIEKNNLPINFSISGFSDLGKVSISDANSLDGRNKIQIIAQFLSASVDNEKDPILGKINANSSTFNVIETMILMGYNEETIIKFINQPAVKDFIELENAISESRNLGQREASTIAANELGVKQEDVELSSKDIGNDKMSQANVQKFLEFRKAGEAIRALKSVINTDSNNLPISMFESFKKDKDAIDLFNELDEDAEQLIVNGYRLLGEGKDENGNIIPTTINGFATVNGLNLSTKLYKGLFSIYDKDSNPIIFNVVNTVEAHLGRPTSPQERKNIINDYKTFKYSDVFKGLMNGNLYQERRRLLESGPQSLASRIERYKEVIDNKLLKTINVNKGKNGLDLVTFNNAAQQGVDEQYLLDAFVELLQNKDTYQLAKDMILMSYLSNSNITPDNFLKFIPVKILETLEVGKKLKQVNRYEELIDEEKGIDNVVEENVFTTQLMQHRPSLAFQITDFDNEAIIISSDESGKITELALNTKTKNKAKAKRMKNAQYISFVNKEGKRLLFIKSNDGTVFLPTNLKGNFNTKEYDRSIKSRQDGVLYLSVSPNNNRISDLDFINTTDEGTIIDDSDVRSSNFMLEDYFDASSFTNLTDSLLQFPEITESQKQIAKTLSRSFKGIKQPSISFASKVNGTGQYDAKSHTITIKKGLSEKSFIDTVLHEGLHSVTSRILNTKSEKRTQEQNDLIDSLEGIRVNYYKKLRDDSSSDLLESFDKKLKLLLDKKYAEYLTDPFSDEERKLYGAFNTKEFLVSVFIDGDIQEDLKVKKFNDKKSIFDRLIDSIKKFLDNFLGVDGNVIPDSDLKDAIGAALGIIESNMQVDSEKSNSRTLEEMFGKSKTKQITKIQPEDQTFTEDDDLSMFTKKRDTNDLDLNPIDQKFIEQASKDLDINKSFTFSEANDKLILVDNNIPSKFLSTLSQNEDGTFKVSIVRRSDDVDLKPEDKESKLVRALRNEQRKLENRIKGNISNEEKSILIKKIAQLEKDIIDISDDAANGDIAIVANRQLDEIINDISRGKKFTDEELYTLSQRVFLWKNLPDYILDIDRLQSDERYAKSANTKAINDVSNRAKNIIDRELINLIRENVEGHSKNLGLSKNASFNNLQEDIDILQSLFYPLEDSQGGIPQTVAMIIKNANNKADYALSEEYKNIDEVHSNFKNTDFFKKFGFKKLVDSKGRLQDVRNQEYYNQINKFKRKITALEKRDADPNLITEAKADYYNFIRESNEYIDVAQFYELDNEGNLVEKDNQAYKNELIKKYNSGTASFILKRTEEKMKMYQKDYKNQLELLNDNQITKATFDSWVQRNSPFVYSDFIHRNQSIAVNGVYNNGWKYIHSEPAEKYRNKDFHEIQNFQESDGSYKAMEYLNWYKDQMQTYYDLVPQHISAEFNSTFIPFLPKNLVEEISDTGFSFTGVGDRLLKTLNDKEYSQPEIDTVTQQNHMELNLGIKKPKFVTEGERDRAVLNSTKDLQKIMKFVSNRTYTYAYKAEVEDKIRLAQTLLNTQKEDTGNGTRSDSSIINLKKQLNYTIESSFYDRNDPTKYNRVIKDGILSSDDKKTIKEIEEINAKLRDIIENDTEISDREKDSYLSKIKKNEEYIDSLGGVLTTRKLVRNILNYLQVKGMGFNVGSAIGNFMFAFTANRTHAAGGEDFNLDDFGKAFKSLSNNTLNILPGAIIGGALGTAVLGPVGTLIGSGIGGLFNFRTSKGEAKRTSVQMKYFRAMGDIIDVNDFEKDYYTEEKKFYDTLSPYELQRRSEFFAYGTTLKSMLYSKKVAMQMGLEDGVLDDLFDAEGNLNDKGKEFLTEAKYDKFKNKLDRVNRVIHGNYDKNSPVLAKKSVLGQAALQFRSWVSDGVQTRFEGIGKKEEDLKYDEYLERRRMGRYAPFIGRADAFKNLQRLMKRAFLFNKKQYDDLSELEMAAIRKTAAELQMLSIGLIGVLALKAIGDDDDESWGGYMRNYSINRLMRLNEDLTYFVNPIQMKDVGKIPLLSIVPEAAKTLNYAWRVAYDDEATDKTSDAFTRSAVRLFPGGNSFYSVVSATERVY